MKKIKQLLVEIVAEGVKQALLNDIVMRQRHVSNDFYFEDVSIESFSSNIIRSLVREMQANEDLITKPRHDDEQPLPLPASE